jgi:hypothetical protein
VIGSAIRLPVRILAALARVAAVVIAVVGVFPTAVRQVPAVVVRAVAVVHRLRNATTTGATLVIAVAVFANTATRYSMWQAEIKEPRRTRLPVD